MFPQNLCIPSKLSSGLSECIFEEPAGKKLSKLKISGSNSEKKIKKLIIKKSEKLIERTSGDVGGSL